jgi:hypothetical protein
MAPSRPRGRIPDPEREDFPEKNLPGSQQGRHGKGLDHGIALAQTSIVLISARGPLAEIRPRTVSALHLNAPAGLLADELLRLPSPAAA